MSNIQLPLKQPDFGVNRVDDIRAKEMPLPEIEPSSACERDLVTQLHHNKPNTNRK